MAPMRILDDDMMLVLMEQELGRSDSNSSPSVGCIGFIGFYFIFFFYGLFGIWEMRDES
jgi:hypothetical protein